MPSRSVRFIRKSPKLSISFDFCPPFIDYFDEAYELIQSNLNVKFHLFFNFFLLTILKFKLKKLCQRRLVGSTHRQGLQEIRVDRREWRVEDLKELKDSSFRMYDICTKIKKDLIRIENKLFSCKGECLNCRRWLMCVCPHLNRVLQGSTSRMRQYDII